MRRKILFVIWLTALQIFLTADHRENYPGTTASPCFDKQALLQTLRLYFREMTSSGHFCIKNDSSGQPWIVREVRTDTGWEVRMGKIEGDGIENEISVSRGVSETQIAPDLDFSSADQPWVAWVNQTNGTWRLLVQNTAIPRTWEIIATQTPVFTPDIIADKTGRIWIVWTGVQTGYDEIFFSYLKSEAWSRPESLTPDPAVPHFHPAVTLDASGYPLAVWSAFGPNGYQLYSSAWTGKEWEPAVPLPHEPGSSDAEPAAVLWNHSIPIVAWTRSGRKGSRIFLSYRAGENWSTPIPLSPEKKQGRLPSLASVHDELAVMWESTQGVVLKTFTFSELLEKPSPVEFSAFPVSTAALMDNKFIAFGDSITYGSTNGPRMGEGYPPRLQLLLEQLFFYPCVVNKGLPGEPTWHALGRIQSVLTHEMALYLLLMEGTNDVSTPTYSLDATVFNLEQMVLKAEKYGTFPLVSTIIPRARTRWTPSARTRTLELNEKIIQLTEDLKLMLVDNYSAFIQFPSEDGGHAALICDDDLHPNGSGYQLMAETWHEGIRVIPFPPVDITALRMYRNREVRLSWEDSPRNDPETDIRHYRILRRRKDSQSGFKPIGVALASKNEYTDTAASLDREYIYSLRAMNINGIEGPSSTPVLPVRGDPFAPVSISRETIVNHAFLYREIINRVSWLPNPQNESLFAVTKYRIYRKHAGEEDDHFTLIGEADAGTHAYMDRNLPSEDAAKAYAYGVSAVTQNNIEGIIGKG
jgi:lysophospholipase L1-like esterase